MEGHEGWPAIVRKPASAPAPAKSPRSVTTDIRLMSPTTITVDSTMRLAT